MKKLFLIGLMMLAGSAWAEWEYIAESELASLWVDPSTIKKMGADAKFGE